jgi:hypothetical protein
VAAVGSCVNREQVVGALLAMGVPASVLNDFPQLTADVEGLLVYGSQARGDAVLGSDLDLASYVRPATCCAAVCTQRPFADGDPCFSVRELVSRHQDPLLAHLLASRQPGDPTVADLA